MDKIIKEEIIDIKGTTKLVVGDPLYFSRIDEGIADGAEKDLVFDGNISAAPLGKLKIQQVHVKTENLEYDTIEVVVYQAGSPKFLDVYLEDKHYPSQIKKEIDLGCDSAQFYIETKFGSDNFHTGADGYYGFMYQYKQYYGMKLCLSFDADLFEFEEVKERMLKLFPKIK